MIQFANLNNKDKNANIIEKFKIKKILVTIKIIIREAIPK
jgi:hypothetical protein